ncbi:Crp/Fnr family transcriptional regulator [Ekhidna sp.]|uniref:Crp/Fnr family transcriptional regulator n=1 Tax=Ekhidna sp. TaxID=2608089 RepID=UPI003B59D0B2
MKDLAILQHIERFVSLNEEEKNAFSAIVEEHIIKRKSFIVQPGFVCKHQTHIVRGALRSYFITPDGSEHTIAIAIDDWWISDFYSYTSQTPASLYVEALEDSVVQQISYDNVERICNDHPRFERFFRLVAQKAFAYSQRRALSNIGKTAEERYLEYAEMYPQIIQRIPQYIIASYLGMSPEFLSKIRKKLASSS